jgi:tetratricopeptide (TPR) repeat protein
MPHGVVPLIVGLSLSLALAGSRAQRSARRIVPPSLPYFDSIMSRANALTSAGQFQAARSQFSKALPLIPAAHPYYRAAFLIGVANSHFYLQEFAEALKIYEEAAAIARAHKFDWILVSAAVNRASVYRQMNAHDAARAAMREVEPLVNSSREPMVILQAANVMRSLDMQEAERLYTAAAESAAARADRKTEAAIWNQLGYAWLLRGELARAEPALVAAYRIRALTSDPSLPTSCFYLAWLKRLKGDRATASSLLARAGAVEQVPKAFLHYERAMQHLDAGDTKAALDEFELAVRAAGDWRLQIVPAETFRLGYDIGLQQIYSAYVRAAMALYAKSGDSGHARLAFSVAEEKRSTFFRQSFLQGAHLPPEYWETLARYKKALARSLIGDLGSVPEVTRLRVDLAHIEGAFGFGTEQAEKSHQINERRASDFLLSRLQRKLRADEALISFFVSDEISYRWTVTQTTIEVETLPGRAGMERAAGAFRTAIQTRDPAAVEHGAGLYSLLFGGLSAGAVSKRSWLLSLDGPLFEVPFAALVTERDRSPSFLVERNSIRLAPGAAMLLEPGRKPDSGPDFVAVADAVYNPADPRWRGPKDVRRALDLPRIPGTSREAIHVSRAWTLDSEPVVLTGFGSNRERIRASLESSPAVLHIAAHVVSDAAAPDQVMVALGLQENGEADYLTPAEIAAWQRSARLVALSGCASGRGLSHPGLGLFGLARAWLLSGAQSVVASYWPVADDDGRLLAAMYGRLSSEDGDASPAGAAEALRQAQIRALRSGGSRAHPAHWAAFFVMGKG